MPYTISLDLIPAGIALHSAREGESVQVCSRMFCSTEDGLEFASRLESFAEDFLKDTGQRFLPRSMIDHLLAIIRRDRTVTVYVNELKQLVQARVRRDVTSGERIFSSDIVDIFRVTFDGITIPEDAGVFFYFSVGWRKGLYFDFEPLHSDPQIGRTYDLLSLLASFKCYLCFQKRFAVSDEEWTRILDQQWFLFAGLRNETNDRIIDTVRSGWSIDEILDRIVREVSEDALDTFLSCWARHPVFHPHLDILRRAAERLRASDFISATAILYPRIEGIIRTHQRSIARSAKPSQSGLVQSATALYADRTYSLLLPQKFQEYLATIYFASFNPDEPHIKVSRHSVSHGVAAQDAFSAKAAVIGVLIVQQLYYFFSGGPDCVVGE